VKHEPPDIDLAAPLPPASPSEDPLLLRGTLSELVRTGEVTIIDDDIIQGG
jgi:hypothetical protein